MPVGRGTSGWDVAASGRASPGRGSWTWSGITLSPSLGSWCRSGDEKTASRGHGGAGWWKSPCPDLGGPRLGNRPGLPDLAGRDAGPLQARTVGGAPLRQIVGLKVGQIAALEEPGRMLGIDVGAPDVVECQP